MWMAMLGKLSTKDRLFHFGVVDNDLCPMCYDVVESVQHLFFHCKFSAKCVQLLAKWLRIAIHPQLPRFDKRKWKIPKDKKRVAIASLCSLVYNIWKVRNEALWAFTVISFEAVVERIKSAIRVTVVFFRLIC